MSSPQAGKQYYLPAAHQVAMRLLRHEIRKQATSANMFYKMYMGDESTRYYH
jgi:hypothetical protein